MSINWRDFLERVGWTAIQATAGATLVVLTTDNIIWGDALKFVGVTVGIAVFKVILAQQTGDRGSGDAFPGGTQPKPTWTGDTSGGGG